MLRLEVCGFAEADVEDLRGTDERLRDWAARTARASQVVRLRNALRALGLPPEGLIAAGLVSVGIAIVGPYDSRALSFVARLVYWSGMILASFIIWGVTFKALSSHRRTARWSWVIRVLATNLVMALSGAGLTVLIRTGFGMGLPPGSVASQILAIFIPFFLIASVVVTPILALVFWKLRKAQASGKPAPDNSPFLRRIPDGIRGELLFLKAEDHYLRVVTDRGEDLILFRFKDALDELRGIEGLQVHRSYWVSASAVARLTRAGRDVQLELKTGQTVPVSRRFTAKVRETFGRL